ncbi:MAG: hypothetical protein LQ343_003572 [Gyalolechia ehrenbergii]|nr:MAG: hypothetical protein LQ343_003572 [Gyalolechia ehrenbergii]
MDANGASLYSRFTGLKDKQSGLQTWISVGGWSFTDPGPSQKAFSNMASSQENRSKFVQGLMKFMSTYGFDGVDLDWEYPGADDRGGVQADTANYVLLAQELKAAFGSRYGLSMTLPTSFWYLQHFDLPGIQQHIDWFNLMAYDLHGTWDAASKFVGPYLAPHTNITEIDLGMDLLWRAGVTPERVVLGQGLYGRSFTLSDPSCNAPNGVCQFSGAANAGPCSRAPGILDKQEINDIITKNHLQPVCDRTSGVKWITWDSNQWVSYDDADTFKQKKDFANSRCLGGLMVWAMDQVDQTGNDDLGLTSDVTADQQDDAKQMSADQLAGITCRTSACGSDCPSGSSKVTETNGQPGQLSTSERCPKGKYQAVCCDHGTTMGKCQWRGFRGAGLSCISGCAYGETEVTTNKNNHDGKKGDQTCNGGVQSYCCAGFKPAPTKQQLGKEAADAAKAAAEAAAEQAALDVAAKVFCRVAVPALLAPLELLEAAIPIIGEIADIAEIAATPAIIQGCVKGIEKAGKAEFKVFGKKHTLSLDKPSVKPSATRPPASSHETPKSSTDDKACTLNKRALEKRGLCAITKYTATTTLYQTVSKECDGGKWPQACFHYQSAIREANRPDFNPVTCSEYVPPRQFMQGGPATALWSKQHDNAWKPWLQRPQRGCQRDEWPPQHFWQGRAGQVIRYNHAEDNTGAGSLWRNFCPEHADERCKPGSEDVTQPPGRRPATTLCKKELTLKVLSLSFNGFPLAQEGDDGLGANECYPKELIDDPTYALLNGDSYFAKHGRSFDARFGTAPDPGLTAGKTPLFRKRHLEYLNPKEFVLEENNSSRRLTKEELDEVSEAMALDNHLRILDEQIKNGLGYVECVGDSCATVATPLTRESTAVSSSMVTETVPGIVDATATAATVLLNSAQSQGSVTLKRSGPGSAAAPVFTGFVQHGDSNF